MFGSENNNAVELSTLDQVSEAMIAGSPMGPVAEGKKDDQSVAEILHRKPPTLQSVQALRALAATTVMFLHVPCMRWGYFGVDIFFVVSGFIVCYISFFDTDNFLLRRVFRVVPLYWAGTIGVFCVAAFVPGLVQSTSPRISYLLESLFFVPYRRPDGGVYPLLFLGWTLQYEMFFYVLFAIALFLGRRKAGFLAILMLVGIVTLGEIQRPAGLVLKFYSSTVILLFAFGICGFLLWKSCRIWLRRGPVAMWMALAVVAYSVALLLDMNVPNGIVQSSKMIPGYVLHGLPALAICVSFLALEGRVRFPWAVLLVGDASYSLYLFHPYVLEAINRKIFSLASLTPATVTVALLGMFLCFVLAAFSYRFFERPSNQYLRHKLLKRKTGSEAGTAFQP
jgi:peptidoglycan/LPS O-acetylase OafA/YrhL